MIKLTPLLLLALLLLSCGEPAKNPEQLVKEKRVAEIRANIERLEVKTNTEEGTLDRGVANELVKNYKDYYNQNASDTLAGEYLFRAASVTTALGKPKEAIQLLATYYDNYKTASKRADAIYLMGYLYDNQIGDKEKAREMYQRTIDVFPQSIWAKEAKSAMAIMHMTDEELLEFLENQNNKK